MRRRVFGDTVSTPRQRLLIIGAQLPDFKGGAKINFAMYCCSRESIEAPAGLTVCIWRNMLHHRNRMDGL